VADNDAASDLGSYGALIRRRKVWILTIVPAALLLSVFLAFWITPLYRSQATLILEQAAIPDTFIKSTVRSYAEQQLDVVQGRVLTTEELGKLVGEYDPYPDDKNLSVEQKALKIIQNTSLDHVDPVTFQPKDQAPAIAIFYQNPDPVRASEVTGRIADLFLTWHQRERVEAARSAAKIIQDRATELTKQLQLVDDEYAKLRIANGGSLPDTKGGDEEARYRAERDLTDLERQLREAEEKESLVSIQLAGTSPNLLVAQGLAGNGLPQAGSYQPPTGLTDIATVKAELADAQLRYTPDHPDVKRLERALAALEAKQNTAAASPGSADNPEYRRLSGELASAKANVLALQGSVARARNQVAVYTAAANPSAALERQVQDLDRRRQALQTEYQENQDKLKSAELGQVAESGKNAEHFTELQSPYPASQPHSPNRIGVILLGLVLGCAIAGVAVVVAESTDDTVRGARDVGSLDSIPVLATIPEILLASDERRRRRVWVTVTAAYLLVAGLDAGVVLHAHVRAHRVEDSVTTVSTQPAPAVTPSPVPASEPAPAVPVPSPSQPK
jgi:uncharacterized protein involved in exopolysaccharide biosynthesis